MAGRSIGRNWEDGVFAGRQLQSDVERVGGHVRGSNLWLLSHCGKTPDPSRTDVSLVTAVPQLCSVGRPHRCHLPSPAVSLPNRTATAGRLFGEALSRPPASSRCLFL